MSPYLGIEKKKWLEILYGFALTLIPVTLSIKGAEAWISAALDWLQFCLILVLVIIIMRDERASSTHKARSDHPLEQFLYYWRNLWCVWLALYLFFGIHDTFEALNEGKPLDVPLWTTGLHLIANVFNNFQSLFILLLFLVVAKKTTGRDSAILDSTTRYAFLAILTLAVFEALAYVLTPSAFNRPYDLRTGFSRHVGLIASIISGLFAGVSFCLFFSGLSSHLLRLRAITISALYLYATIQPLYPVFRILDLPSTDEIFIEQTNNPSPQTVSITNPPVLAVVHLTHSIQLPQQTQVMQLTQTLYEPRPAQTNNPSRPSTTDKAGKLNEIGYIQMGLKMLAGLLKFVLFLQVQELIKNGELAAFLKRVAKDQEELSR